VPDADSSIRKSPDEHASHRRMLGRRVAGRVTAAVAVLALIAGAALGGGEVDRSPSQQQSAPPLTAVAESDVIVSDKPPGTTDVYEFSGSLTSATNFVDAAMQTSGGLVTVEVLSSNPNAVVWLRIGTSFAVQVTGSRIEDVTFDGDVIHVGVTRNGADTEVRVRVTYAA
jgi:hypothetical protein